MLQFLRRKENIKKIMWALAAIIVPAFVLWGAGSSIRSGGAPKYAGRIFGKKVSFSQYQASLRAFRNQALLIYGEEFSRVAESLDLEKEAWVRLILLQEAKKEKIKVSDKQLITFIQKLPLFQKGGLFDQARYNTLLDYAFRVSPREFEEEIREALKIDELKNKVISKVTLTDEEIENVYKNENEKASAFYVLIGPEKFEKQIHPSHEELEDYHIIHKSEFKKPEQVNVQYIALYFDKEEPLQDELKVALEDKIWQISDEIQDGVVSFEEAAKKYELPVKESGFFGPQDVIPDFGLSYEFLKAAFSLKTGGVSKVIETSKAYLIIKVKEKKEACFPELEEIKDKVEQALIKQKSRQLAKDEAKNALSQIKKMMAEENLTFSKAVEKLNLTVQETEEFTRSGYISGIGQAPGFNQAAFGLEQDQISEVIAVASGYCILNLKGITPIEQEKFIEEREDFTKALLARKKDIYYRIWLTELEKQAKLINNIAKLKNKPGRP